jgi:hypothetical protein
MEVKNCTICSKSYIKRINTSRLVWSKSKYCSRRCVNIGRIPWNKGIKGVLKAWNKGLPGLKGDKNGAWKGTDDKYFRKIALERDKYTCRSCGFSEKEIMQVDHIKPKMLFPELRFNIENLQTLCPNCHARKTIKELSTF